MHNFIPVTGGYQDMDHFLANNARVVRADFSRVSFNPEESVAKRMDAARETGMYSADFDLYAQGAHGALSAGDLAAAREFLGKMNALLVTDRRLDVSTYYFLSAWEALCRHDVPRAVDQSRTALAAASEALSLIHI